MAWFESVAEAQRRARRTLPRSVYKAILAGAERGQTYRDNLDAFAELGFAPHVAGGSAVRSQATSVMGVLTIRFSAAMYSSVFVGLM